MKSGGVGLTHPGEKVPRRPHCGIPLLKGNLQTGGRLTFYTGR